MRGDAIGRAPKTNGEVVDTGDHPKERTRNLAWRRSARGPSTNPGKVSGPNACSNISRNMACESACTGSSGCAENWDRAASRNDGSGPQEATRRTALSDRSGPASARRRRPADDFRDTDADTTNRSCADLRSDRRARSCVREALPPRSSSLRPAFAQGRPSSAPRDRSAPANGARHRTRAVGVRISVAQHGFLRHRHLHASFEPRARAIRSKTAVCVMSRSTSALGEAFTRDWAPFNACAGHR
ncbi:hypothetical protein ABIC49_001785 [Burkholderia ambifaria]